VSTSYQSIYSSFTSKITDDYFTSISIEASEEDMILLLNDCLIMFPRPKIDIFDKDDSSQQFNVTLGYHEIQIIGNLMKIAWLDRQISNIALVRQSISDSEFKKTSQANHIKALIDMRKLYDEYCHKIIREYKKTLSDNLTIDYSGLAGDV